MPMGETEYSAAHQESFADRWPAVSGGEDVHEHGWYWYAGHVWIVVKLQGDFAGLSRFDNFEGREVTTACRRGSLVEC